MQWLRVEYINKYQNKVLEYFPEDSIFKISYTEHVIVFKNDKHEYPYITIVTIHSNSIQFN